MGSSINKSSLAQSTPQIPFSEANPPLQLSSSNSAKEMKRLSQTKEIIDLTTFLIGNKINSAFKLGRRKKDLISKEMFFNKSYTINVILNINASVKFLLLYY